MYSDENLLLLSGIQHIVFCPRQWALIHLEQQWEENLKTIEGKHLHERVDDPFLKDSVKDCLIWRAVNLVSYRLGLSGRADVVEFHRKQNGLKIPGRSGSWMPFPVEYKRGKPKSDESDEVQLCAQAMCMEEMFGTKIGEGALYYGETRRRSAVNFSTELRFYVVKYASEMHRLFDNGITPPPVYKPHCKFCSLVDICIPQQLSNKRLVTDYLTYVLQ